MSRARRVLFLTTELHPAGAERVIYELATRLPRARWDLRVASLRSPGGDPGQVARDLQRAGIPVELLAMRGKLDPRGPWRLLRLLRRWRPALVHAHLFHANLAARLLGRAGGARRILSTVHIVERRPLRLRRALEQLSARRDDLTVCVSQAVAAHARARLGVSPARLRVVPNGIDLARYEAGEDAGAARAALGLSPEAMLVGAVGRLDRQKGLDVLLEAFARLDRTDARLVLAGRGPAEEALRAQASRLGVTARVHFLGFRADVPRVLAALDLFCLPSRWEGFGLALVEALAAGKPCVASAVDSLPEVLGEAGVLVPPEDPVALARALERLLADEGARARLAAGAPAQAARFGVAAMVAGYERIYEEALSSG